MADAAWLLQKALFKVLDDGLTVPVFDSVPSNPTFPYVTCGTDVWTDTSSKVEANQEFACTIHAWSRQRGKWEAKQLLDQVDELLNDQTLIIEDVGSPGAPPYEVVECRRRDGDPGFTDPDGLTTHGVVTYRILICAV
jgi:uncharacterized protein DUF3168